MWPCVTGVWTRIPRRVDMRHDGHQVHRLVRRRFINLQRVGQPAMVITWIRNTPDDRESPLFRYQKADPGNPQSGSGRWVATGGQLEIIFIKAFLIIGIAMEEDVCDRFSRRPEKIAFTPFSHAAPCSSHQPRPALNPA